MAMELHFIGPVTLFIEAKQRHSEDVDVHSKPGQAKDHYTQLLIIVARFLPILPPVLAQAATCQS